jgi:hypothetical protein
MNLLEFRSAIRALFDDRRGVRRAIRAAEGRRMTNCGIKAICDDNIKVSTRQYVYLWGIRIDCSNGGQIITET